MLLNYLTRRLLWNKYFILFFILLILQQMMIASTNFCLVKLGVSVVSGKMNLLFCLIQIVSYFLILIASEIPSFLSSRFLESARFYALRSYAELFIDTHFNKPILGLKDQYRSEQDVWLSTRAERTINNLFGVIFNGANLLFGVFLSIISVSLAGNPKLLYGYSLSVILMLLISFYSKKKMESLTEQAGDNKGKVDELMQSGWDNIVIGNTYNLQIWQEYFYQRLMQAKNSSLHLLDKIRSTELFTRLIISIPVFINILALVESNLSNKVKLAALLVTLPIQMRILPELCAVSSYLSIWNKTLTEFRLLRESIEKPKQLFEHGNFVPESKIQWQLISFGCNYKSFSFISMKDAINKINCFKFGRICIRGPNGSGKSTFANILKQELGSNAVYVPAHSKMIFKNIFNKGLSTGQKIRLQLSELFEIYAKTKERFVIILDEWDANLDNTAIVAISSMLDIAAKSHLIIEIRHREKNISQEKETGWVT